MHSETKILLSQIKEFRKYSLNEGVSSRDIIDYINNREYIMVNYRAEDGERQASGMRTVRPYVYGTDRRTGDEVIRVWQDKGNSWHYKNQPTRPMSDLDSQKGFSRDGQGHDFWYDKDNSMKSGWRVMKLSNILSVFPTGKKFIDDDGKIFIPPKYKANADADIQVKEYVPISRETVVQEPEEEPEEPRTTKRIDKWKQFEDADASKHEINRRIVDALKRRATTAYKKPISDFIVVVNYRGEFDLIERRNLNKVPEKAVVGDLPYLISSYLDEKPKDRGFFSDGRKKHPQQMNERNRKEGGIPHKIRSFFN
ncbi:MAG: hypothetical protein ACOC22_02365 [bacterium]